MSNSTKKIADQLFQLNEMQRQAVLTTEGPLLIIAGAGSGKTRVLTHRVAYLLAEKKVHPWNILAITFTNKAAREMKERICKLVGDQAEDIWISTFHSMCVKILRRDIDQLGFSRNFTIIDTADQLSLMKKIFAEENLDSKLLDPKSVLNQISKQKNRLVSPGELRESAINFFEQRTAELYEKYQQKLQQNQSLDFDDLLMQTINLFKKVPAVKEYYQRKFKYIHVDEYQDTNHAQYVLVKMLSEHHQNICVVGDSDQSIYQFRGADITNILHFERDYPQARLIKLEQNYRSTKTILKAANHLIANNTERKEKQLWTDNEEGRPVQLYEVESETEEAHTILEMIMQGVEQGHRYRDYAILYRTNAQSRVLEEELRKAFIPYQVVGGFKFYDRKEIKDLLCYLRAMVNPDDDLSITRIINVPKRGIGAATLKKIEAYRAEHNLSLFQALLEVEQIGLTRRVVKPIQQFVTMIQQFHRMSEFLSVAELTKELLNQIPYREELQKEKSIEAMTRLENIDEFLTVVQEFEKNNEDQSVVAFLTDLALIADIDQLDQPTEQVKSDDYVTLMTLHSAKGLEFPYVFLVGMEEGIFPHQRSLQSERALEEERRLAYVGMTRAQRQLALFTAKTRKIFGQTHFNLPSRFIAEIPDPLLEKVSKRNVSVRQTVNKIHHHDSADKKDWQVGDKVHHKKWGQGTVVKVVNSGEETELNVAFSAPIGVKKLLARYAPIKRIDSN